MTLHDSDLCAFTSIEKCAIGTDASECSLVNLSVAAGEAGLAIPEGVLRAQALGVLAVPHSAIGAGSEGQAGLPVEVSANWAHISRGDALSVDKVHSGGTLALEGLAGCAVPESASRALGRVSDAGISVPNSARRTLIGNCHTRKS